MKNRQTISLARLQGDIQTLKQELADFSAEKYEPLKDLIGSLKNDTANILEESKARNDERVQRRPGLEEKRKEAIREKNWENMKNEIIKKTFVKKDDRYYVRPVQNKKFKASDFETGYEPVTDHYAYIRGQLEAKEKEIICGLTNALEEAYAKTKDIYAHYNTPGELFEKLGIKIQKVEYSFFAKENNNAKIKVPRNGGAHDAGGEKDPCEAPTFKKIGYLMKYLKENDIPFRANNIIQDNDQRYQFYFYKHDITILISDVVTANGFRDSTYIVKGMVPGLKYVNKEELKNYQGKKMVFNDTWPQRIESVFADNPENRVMFGEEKEEQIIQKTLITDRAKFIGIIKANFTPETFNGESYRKFAKEYNAKQGNELLLNDTVYGAVSLLGLGGKKGVGDIRRAIFESKKPTLEIPSDAYLRAKNAHVSLKLIDISNCEGFSPEEVLGSVNYGRRVLELLRKAYKEEFVDAVKNKSMKEKKAKLEEYTGIREFPLFSMKITSMLGGRVRSVDGEYQKMLRKKFMMHRNNQTTLQEYKDLQEEIVKYETKWENEALIPNTNKSDKRSKKTEKNDEENKTVEKPVKAVSKKVKEIQEKTQTDITETLKAPLTLKDFPLFKVKSAKIVGETSEYRLVKVHNCTLELRMNKALNNGIALHVGDKVEVFIEKKDPRYRYLRALREKQPGYHKIRKFLSEHDTPIEEFKRGKKYSAVVNNIEKGFIRVSINRQYTGRINVMQNSLYNAGSDISVGSTIKVEFNGINNDYPNRVNLVY